LAFQKASRFSRNKRQKHKTGAATVGQRFRPDHFMPANLLPQLLCPSGMSEFGHYAILGSRRATSASPVKADIARHTLDVGQVPISDLDRLPSIAEIRRTPALVCVIVAITTTPAAPETLDKRRRIEGRDDAGTRCGKSFVHVRAALAQRTSREQRHEEYQQGKRTRCGKPK
jgi:hypothetical protein